MPMCLTLACDVGLGVEETGTYCVHHHTSTCSPQNPSQYIQDHSVVHSIHSTYTVYIQTYIYTVHILMHVTVHVAYHVKWFP